MVIIWDFNGTLLDDVDAAIAAVTDMLVTRGGQPMHREWYYQLVEMPIERFYRKIPLFDAVPFDILAEEFNAGYLRHQEKIKLALGGEIALQQFKGKGYEQVILSSFEQSRIEMWLERFEIAHYFSTVLGADDIQSTGKTERAKVWAHGKGLDSGSAVLIGDTVHDWETAQALGVPCILVSYGHQHGAELAQFGPVIEDLASLPPLVAEIFDRKEAVKL